MSALQPGARQRHPRASSTSRPLPWTRLSACGRAHVSSYHCEWLFHAHAYTVQYCKSVMHTCTCIQSTWTWVRGSEGENVWPNPKRPSPKTLSRKSPRARRNTRHTPKCQKRERRKCEPEKASERVSSYCLQLGQPWVLQTCASLHAFKQCSSRLCVGGCVARIASRPSFGP